MAYENCLLDQPGHTEAAKDIKNVGDTAPCAHGCDTYLEKVVTGASAKIIKTFGEVACQAVNARQ